MSLEMILVPVMALVVGGPFVATWVVFILRQQAKKRAALRDTQQKLASGELAQLGTVEASMKVLAAMNGGKQLDLSAGTAGLGVKVQGRGKSGGGGGEGQTSYATAADAVRNGGILQTSNPIAGSGVTFGL